MNLIKRLRAEYAEIEERMSKAEDMGNNEFLIVRMAEISKVMMLNDRALMYYENLHSMYPENNIYRISMAELYAHNDDYQRAISVYKDLIEKEGSSAAIYMGMGDAYRALGEYREALDNYRRAHEIYRRKFRRIVTFENEVFDPSRNPMEEVQAIINRPDPALKAEVGVGKDVKSAVLDAHITKPFLYELPLLREEMKETLTDLVPMKIDLGGERDDAEIKAIKDALYGYLNYIDAYPLDTYALETTARIATAIGEDSPRMEEAMDLWSRILGIYCERTYHVGEKVEEIRHHIQVALRLGREDEIGEQVRFLERWNPMDPLLALL